jgi:hypothetical protein
MPGKPRGERALTDAERQARRRLRIAADRRLADEALAFLLTIEEEDVRSMRWEHRKTLRSLQTRARGAIAHAAS